jgi:hypothetical protein
MSPTKDFRLSPSFCPYCFKLLDSAMNTQSESPPGPGDFTICIQCCSILRFSDAMDLLASSLAEVPAHIRMKFARAVLLCRQIDRSDPNPPKADKIH